MLMALLLALLLALALLLDTDTTTVKEVIRVMADRDISHLPHLSSIITLLPHRDTALILGITRKRIEVSSAAEDPVATLLRSKWFTNRHPLLPRNMEWVWAPWSVSEQLV